MATRRIPRRADSILRSQSLPRCTSTGWSRVTSTSSVATRLLSTEAPLIQPKYINPELYEASLLPQRVIVKEAPKGLKQVSTIPAHIRDPDVFVTLYQYPTFEPLKLLQYPATHLRLPSRPDILHDAIIYEHNAARRLLEYVFHRSEMAGTGKKLARQKGGGRARIGDSKAPHLARGAETAHPPKPRDVSTALPRKVYDLAWRTALTARYNRGELVVVDHVTSDSESTSLQLARHIQLFKGHSNGIVGETAFKAKPKQRGQDTLWVLDSEERAGNLRRALKEWYETERVEASTSVDVKNLLEGKQIVIEQDALNRILRERQSDLQRAIDIEGSKKKFAKDAESMAAAVQATKELQTKSLNDTLRAQKETLDKERAARAKHIKASKRAAVGTANEKIVEPAAPVDAVLEARDSKSVAKVEKAEEAAEQVAGKP